VTTKKSTRAPPAREPLGRVAKGLPASWYYDPVHYTRELDVFWYGRWIAASRGDEIPDAGDWRVFRIGTQAIVLLRDEHGAVRAFHNTCRHRGSILCTAEAGRFERRRIVCPYHSWTYDLGGDLVATPRRMPRRTSIRRTSPCSRSRRKRGVDSSS
jgi:Rieske 2Fe-2S family protein